MEFSLPLGRIGLGLRVGNTAQISEQSGDLNACGVPHDIDVVEIAMDQPVAHVSDFGPGDFRTASESACLLELLPWRRTLRANSSLLVHLIFLTGKTKRLLCGE